MKILDIKLTYNCNNHCLLCCQDDSIKNINSTISTEQIYDFIKNMSKEDIPNTKVILTGGEPTTHPEILNILDRLKKFGFKNIQIQTNATLKGVPYSILDLINKGVSSFGISLHGCTADMHENFTNTIGSFKNTIDNLTTISKLNIPVALNCVITKYNIDALSDIVQFISNYKLANNIQFAFIHITGRASNQQNLIPQIKDAATAVQKAITLANKYDIRVKSEAIPFCLMKGFEKNVAELEKLNKITILDKKGIFDFSGYRKNCLKEKSENCLQCLFYSLCEGPWREYPQLFGWEEFIPVRSMK